MTYLKSLLIVMRRESLGDFEAIARRVRKMDPSIWIHLCPDRVDPQKIPPGFLNLPLLSIYLVNPPPDSFKPTAGQLAVKSISKLEEYEHFKKHNIPCLPIEAFHWGMTLDKSVYGDWVVLKPQTIQSTGKDVNMVPTNLIPTLKLDDFPEDHLIRKDDYYVQKFIKTGETPTHHRVLVFCGEVLYSSSSTNFISYPPSESNLDFLLSTSITANFKGKRKIYFTKSNELIDLALKTAATFKDLPLLGVDIICDTFTKKLYVLEVNAGGNVWHFSSEIGKGLRRDLGGSKIMVSQYGAWDRAAKALLDITLTIAK